MTPVLIVCESTAAITPHIREVVDIPVSYSGFWRRPLSLCGAEIAWDTLLPIGSARCGDCLAIAALALATPASRCPHCRDSIGLPYHEVRCPVMSRRSCASCTRRSFLYTLVPVWQDGRLYFWCRDCAEGDLRTGRWSFGEASRSGTAKRSGGGGAL